MRRAGVLAVVALLVLGAIVPVSAHDPSEELEEVRQEIDRLASQINQARAESRQVGEQLAAARDRLAAAQAELAEAQGKVDAIRGRIADEEGRRDQLTVQIGAVETELADTRSKIRETQERLDLQAVSLYMNASASITHVMLSFDSTSDLTVGLVYAGGLTDQSEDLLTTFEYLKREEERQRDLLEQRRAEVEAILAQLDAERAVLEAEVARVEGLREEAEAELGEVRSLLARIQNEIATAEQHIEGLEADAKRLEAEIAARQSSGGENPGVLAWPVSGPVTSPYGYRVHPIFGTRRLHTGIDIGAPSGARIGAAGSGVVILSGPYGGYGYAVVIDHGGGLSTLYAHQSSIAVSNGQTVSTGDTVGYVGCTGFCTGPHLHFETRENGVPVDPMKYLGG